MKVIILISRSLRAAGAVVLTFLFSITMLDVILRAVWKPVTGVYELVSLSGAIVVVFALPVTSLENGHVFMDVVIDRLSPAGKKAMYALTRIMVMLLFIVLGVALFVLADEFATSGELLLTLKWPVYPMTYVVGVICFIQSVVICFDLIRSLGEKK